MVVASWIVTAAEDNLAEVRRALARVAGAQVCGSSDPIVVTTECDDPDMGALHRSLADIPGVVSVAMVVAHREPVTEDAR